MPYAYLVQIHNINCKLRYFGAALTILMYFKQLIHHHFKFLIGYLPIAINIGIMDQ
jgi:hypothetical protein